MLFVFTLMLMFVCTLFAHLCTCATHREAKTKVLSVGEVVLGIAGSYYEDHLQPVTDSYSKWASDVKSSMWEKIQTTIDNYMPF